MCIGELIDIGKRFPLHRSAQKIVMIQIALGFGTVYRLSLSLLLLLLCISLLGAVLLLFVALNAL